MGGGVTQMVMPLVLAAALMFGMGEFVGWRLAMVVPGVALLLVGVALILFSQMSTLFLAVGAMIVFSLFVQMSEGATYSVAPFINKRALGSVAGIVGAGGNAGAVAFGFLFRIESLATHQALLFIGLTVIAASALVFLLRFSATREVEERQEIETAFASMRGGAVALEGAAAD